MKKYQKLLIAVAALAAGSISAQELVGAFTYNANAADVTGVQSALVGPTRTSGFGNDANTVGAVAGTLGIFGGGTVGVDDYAGVSTGSFAGNSNFLNLNRFGGVNGGLLTFDYDFSSYLASNPAGTGAGEFNYTVEGNFATRRSDSLTGTFYISYNDGVSKTLDTTLATAIPLGGADELVADASKYTSIGTIAAGATSGTFNFDINSFIEASSDGKIRLVYFDNSFSARIDFLGTTGVVATTVIPEPSTYVMLAGLSVLGFAAVRRRR